MTHMHIKQMTKIMTNGIYCFSVDTLDTRIIKISRFIVQISQNSQNYLQFGYNSAKVISEHAMA